ncbi:MFS transporter [Acrocarpospora pleiomorpha]|uniref:MFS transporter n=1 Tax=Acrocarpospora pleiomorpha TaxID=90975 RepID=UPI002483CEAE
MFGVLAISAASFSMLQSLVVPVLTLIQGAYGTDQSTATWALTGYLLSASICTPILGRVGDVLGKRRMLLIVLSALCLGSLIAALAPTIGWLIAARVLQGAGGAVLPLSFGVIRDEWREQMSRGIGGIAAIAAAGFAAGMVVAGPIVGGLGYRWLFWIPMIITGLAALGAAVVIPDSPARDRVRVPIVPGVLLAGWLVALLLALSRGHAWGWNSSLTIGLLASSAALFVTWIWMECHVPVPMVDMRMMRFRGVWASNVISLFAGFGAFAFFGFLPQLLQAPTSTGYGFGASVTQSGWVLLPSACASFAVGLTSSRLVTRFGARTVTAVGTVVAGVALLVVALFHDSLWQLYAATTMYGLGSGMVFSSLPSVVIGSVPAQQTGVASGMNANLRTIGGAIGAATMGGIVTAGVGADGLPTGTVYTIGFLVLSGGTLLSAMGAAYLPGQPRRQDGTKDRTREGSSPMGRLEGRVARDAADA